jgi:hypothetical protein
VSEFEIRTCAESLLQPGACCVCRQTATLACLTHDLTEHARCERHSTGEHIVATKPLVWNPIWEDA